MYWHADARSVKAAIPARYHVTDLSASTNGNWLALPNVALCLFHFPILFRMKISTALIVDRLLHFGFSVPNTPLCQYLTMIRR